MIIRLNHNEILEAIEFYVEKKLDVLADPRSVIFTSVDAVEVSLSHAEIKVGNKVIKHS